MVLLPSVSLMCHINLFSTLLTFKLTICSLIQTEFISCPENIKEMSVFRLKESARKHLATLSQLHRSYIASNGKVFLNNELGIGRDLF